LRFNRNIFSLLSDREHHNQRDNFCNHHCDSDKLNENEEHPYNTNNIILKYKDLTIEIQRMWNVKTRATPAIIGATGTISKSFRKYVRSIPGNHEVRELQKTAILGTAHILRKVLT
jgi:hypothetical protein